MKFWKFKQGGWRETISILFLLCGFNLFSLEAQTASSPNAGLRLIQNGAGMYTLSWWGILGQQYLIEESPDLANWQFLPVLDPGNNSLLSYGIQSSANQLFFRTVAEANPFAADFNHNNEPDGYEALNAIGPGGLTYLQQYLLNHGPTTTAPPARLGSGGNSVAVPTAGTPSPGATGNPPQIDAEHSGPNSSFARKARIDVDEKIVVRSGSSLPTVNIKLNPLGNETFMGLYRRAGVGPWTTLADVTGQEEYTDNSTLLAGITYQYKLRAMYDTGLTSTSPVKSIAFSPFAGSTASWALGTSSGADANHLGSIQEAESRLTFGEVLGSDLPLNPHFNQEDPLGRTYSSDPPEFGFASISEVKYQQFILPCVEVSKPPHFFIAEIFVPVPLAAGSPLGSPQAFNIHPVPLSPAGGTIGPITVDTTATPTPFAGSGDNGAYYLSPGLDISPFGWLPDPAVNGYTPATLGYQEFTSGVVAVQPPSSGDPGMTAQFWLPYASHSELDLSVYISVDEGSADFRLRDGNGDPVPIGHPISTRTEFPNPITISPLASATNGERCAVTVSLEDGGGSNLGEEKFVVTNQFQPTHPNYGLSFSEATGARHRKLGLNGRPRPDEKPHETAESDEEKEETYLDALTLGLRHSHTDIYVKLPGSDLSLQVRRQAASEVWNMQSGLRPHERLDRPFGAGWTSNLCIYTDTVLTPEGLAYTYVVDQNGDSHRFLLFTGANHVERYVPFPSDSRENGDYLCSFDGNSFVDRYGTSIAFNTNPALNISVLVACNRYTSVGLESHLYAPATSIADRMGNKLSYTYPSGGQTLIPQTISFTGIGNASSVQTQTISIAQKDGQVIAVWDPQGNEIQYGYSAHPYTWNSHAYSETVLATVTLAPTVTGWNGGGPGAVPIVASPVIRYEYDIPALPEVDVTPASINNGQTCDQYHIDLKSIQDPSGNVTTLTYQYDQTRQSIDPVTGQYYPLCGAPRWVSQVTLPANIAGERTVQFSNHSVVKLQFDELGIPSLTPDSLRQNVAQDPLGDFVTYTFGDSQAMNVTGIYSVPSAAIPKVVFYKAMEIAYRGADGTVGAETFGFEPKAGLALSSARDLSGNLTTFSYLDPYPVAAIAKYSGLFTANGFDSVYSDPTGQTDALSQTKIFSYGPWRIMNGVLDEAGRYTSYDVDGLGRRRNEIHYAGANATTAVVQKTLTSYDDARFPGVATSVTVKQNAGDPAWAADLSTQYVLDPCGRVQKKIVDPTGHPLTTQYTYDLNGNKLSETDPKTYVTSFQYDDSNHLVKVVYPDGSDRLLTYYANGNLHTETDANGRTTTYVYDGLNRLLTKTRQVTVQGVLQPETVAYVYSDAVNPKHSESDPEGNTTVFDYDGFQRLKQVTNALNEVTQYSYAGPNAGGNAFDSAGFKPTTVTSPGGYLTTNDYDDLYRLTTSTRQYQLQVIKNGVVTQQPLYSAVNYGYDAVGNQTSVRDALLQTTTVEFDALNRPYHTTYADTHDIWSYFTGTGLKYAAKDELGNVTTTQYDGAGRPVYVLQPTVDDGLNLSDPNRAPHLKSPTTHTVYDDNGNIQAVIDPLGNETDFGFDVRNRKISEQRPLVTDAVSGLQSRPLLQTAYDYVGNVVWTCDARGNATVMTYDEANHLLTTTQPFVWIYGQNTPAQPVTTRTYDLAGNLKSVTDPNGHITGYTYDFLNRLTDTTDANLNTTTRGYDADGNQNYITDGYTAYTMAFDGLHRRVSITDLHQKATVFTYDGVNLVHRVDALNQTTSYSYDRRNQLTGAAYQNRANDDQTITRDFCEAITSVTETGYGGATTVGYGYDACRRLTSETSNGVTHAYTLDLGGNRRRVQYGALPGSAGRSITCAYDSLNRLSTLTEGSRTTTYGYDLNGNVATKTLPDTEVVTTTYDALNRVMAEQDRSPIGLLYNYLSLCDAAGNLKFSSEQTSAVPMRTLVLDYDVGDRLTTETTLDFMNRNQEVVSYDYDKSGNRLHKTVTAAGITTTTTLTYNTLDQLTGYSDNLGDNATYVYDLNGNMTSVTVNGSSDTYGWDYENRLISVTKGTTGALGTHSYIYDYRGRRVSRTEPQGGGSSQTTNIVFSGGTSGQEYANSALTVDYVRGSDWGGGVGGILYTMRSNAPSFDHYDRRGDVVAQTNASGAITFQASYEAEGTHPISFGSTPDRQKANTKEEDPTKLVNEGLRYRDLATNTFLSRDPALFVDGANLYAYVRENPWTHFDPEGLATEEERKSAAGEYGAQVKGYEQTARAEEQAARDNYNGRENVYEQHKALGESARRTAEDMKNRADILAHGTEGDYLERVRKAYGINNPDLNSIAAFYADQFNDKATLDFLSRQHPSARPSLDFNGVAMMLLFPESRLGRSSVVAGEEPPVLDTSAYGRVKLSKGTRAQIWERSKAADGKVYDPSDVEIKPGEPWQAGHIPGHKFSDAQQRAARGGWDQETWKAYQRDPDIYRPEKARTNLSHRYEDEWYDLPTPVH